MLVRERRKKQLHTRPRVAETLVNSGLKDSRPPQTVSPNSQAPETPMSPKSFHPLPLQVWPAAAAGLGSALAIGIATHVLPGSPGFR